MAMVKFIEGILITGVNYGSEAKFKYKYGIFKLSIYN